MFGLTGKDLQKMLSNPFYTLPKVAEIFTEEHKPMISEKDWIKANANVIKEIGSEKWLELLLENLKGNYLKSVDPTEN